MNFLDYFNVKESYQIPDKLLQLLLSDATNLFDLYSAEHLLEKDDLLLDFQLNDASRDSLKQDFTPDGIAEVYSAGREQGKVNIQKSEYGKKAVRGL